MSTTKCKINLPGLSSRLLELRGNTPQVEFSANIAVKQQTYAQWELGHRQPKIQEVVRLAVHFGVSTDWLLGLTDRKSLQQNATLNSDLSVRYQEVNAELRRYKSAFAKLAKSLRNASEVIDEMEGGK